jgi:cyclopropane fatty-acyl-phospholipid synthase-like methyltransferase
VRTRSAVTRRDIVAYFDACEVDYRWIWDLDASLAMHMGHWDETTRTLRDALRRQNELLAAAARVTAADRVLDAGCGVGGSSIFLAATTGCRAHGITLSHKQARAAAENAGRRAPGARTSFSVMDYRHTAFAAGSFDVVWALESVCYAGAFRDFAHEAARVLVPGGRLVLADGFATKKHYAPAEARLMRKCFANWAVPRLETPATVARELAAAGFRDVRYTDTTASVARSTRRLFRHALYGLPLGKLAELIGIRCRTQTGNVVGAYYSHRARARGLVGYGVFSARMPERYARSSASSPAAVRKS